MAHKGFLKTQDGEQPDRNAVKRLQQTGIPLKNIFTDQEFRSDAEWLHDGDHLTVCSLAELYDYPDSLLFILSACITRRIQLHSLDEPWYDTAPETVRQHICGLMELSGPTAYCRKLPSGKQKPRGRPRGLMPESLAKCRACEKLILTGKRPLLDILKSQNLCYATWRRYLRNYKPRLLRKYKKRLN